MASVTRMSKYRDLSARRKITLELPEFLLCALEHRLADANAAPPPADGLTLEHLVEWQLAESLSISEVAALEIELPGIGAAVSRWLADSSET